jgi:hypothetical protein
MFTSQPSHETRNCSDQRVKTVCNDLDKSIAADQFPSVPPVYQSTFGQACCPHCSAVFDLTAAKPAFLEPVPHNDAAVFFMCPKCHAAFQTAGNSGRESMADTCFANITPTGSPRTRHPWAITTMLVMELNDFDVIAALENGHGLSRELYLGICAGTYELVVLPGGVRIVAAKPATRGAL